MKPLQISCLIALAANALPALETTVHTVPFEIPFVTGRTINTQVIVPEYDNTNKSLRSIEYRFAGTSSEEGVIDYDAITPPGEFPFVHATTTSVTTIQLTGQGRPSDFVDNYEFEFVLQSTLPEGWETYTFSESVVYPFTPGNLTWDIPPGAEQTTFGGPIAISNQFSSDSASVPLIAGNFTGQLTVTYTYDEQLEPPFAAPTIAGESIHFDQDDDGVAEAPLSASPPAGPGITYSWEWLDQTGEGNEITANLPIGSTDVTLTASGPDGHEFVVMKTITVVRTFDNGVIEGQLQVTSNPSAFGLATEAGAAATIAGDPAKMADYELYTREAMGELVMDGPLVWVENGEVNLQLELLAGDDLTSMTPLGELVNFSAPAPSGFGSLFFQVSAR